MTVTIRRMTATDRADVMHMMQVFYASPAVHTNGSEEIFSADIDACVSDSPYLEGYVFENENAALVGYAMLAKSFSTEFGKPCVWIEDIYLTPDARGLGLGRKFFEFLHATYKDVVFRLEAEEENERALHLYRKQGYETMPYLEMIKFPDSDT